METYQSVLRRGKPRFPLSIAAPKIASRLQLRFDSLSAQQAERFRRGSLSEKLHSTFFLQIT